MKPIYIILSIGGAGILAIIGTALFLDDKRTKLSNQLKTALAREQKALKKCADLESKEIDRILNNNNDGNEETINIIEKEG